MKIIKQQLLTVSNRFTATLSKVLRDKLAIDAVSFKVIEGVLILTPCAYGNKVSPTGLVGMADEIKTLGLEIKQSYEVKTDKKTGLFYINLSRVSRNKLRKILDKKHEQDENIVQSTKMFISVSDIGRVTVSKAVSELCGRNLVYLEIKDNRISLNFKQRGVFIPTNALSISVLKSIPNIKNIRGKHYLGYNIVTEEFIEV